jgi:para-aminobenzoate synthetase component I
MRWRFWQKMMLKHELAYHHDSALLFERIAAQPWAMLLDSGQMLDTTTGKPGSQYGRYDIIVAEPFITLVTRGEITTITQNGVANISNEDPFLLLINLLKQYPAPKTDLPFAGGVLGYFGYDLARRLEKLSSSAIAAEETPEMMVAIYDWAVIVDHREQRSFLVSHGFDAQTHDKWHALQALFNAPLATFPFDEKSSQFEVTSPIISNLSQPQYVQAFNKIKAYIEAGDCYQVNLAQRFCASVAGDSWQAYKKLREISPAPFMAYMQLPLSKNECFQVLCNSPERFIQVTGDHVETRPIKGTRPRFKDVKQDSDSANELLSSLKDKAENLMIVDLLRNDLSKSCEKVSVTKLFQLQSFANVHHLVSIIVGKLLPNKTAVDVLRSCFPGGSITGAPKLRAMQIIDELEPHRRGLYCGAIGYIGFDGNMDTNIAIRTAINCKNMLSFYAGGGIVADSDASKEYAETLDKASSFTTVLQFFMRL